MADRRARFAALFFALAAALAPVRAQTPAAVSSQARQAYAEGRYTEAARLYALLAASGGDGAAVQYDLGNCHLKAGDVARAIVAYRRALRFEPGLAAARQNLKIARTLLPARAVAWQPPPWEAAIRSLGSDVLTLLTLALALAGNGALWAVLFLGPGRLRRVMVGLMTGALVAAAVAGGLLYYAVKVAPLRQAVVVVGSAKVYERPQGEGAVLATLPPGSEVVRVASAGGWSLLLWGEGSVWALSSEVEAP